MKRRVEWETGKRNGWCCGDDRAGESGFSGQGACRCLAFGVGSENVILL